MPLSLFDARANRQLLPAGVSRTISTIGPCTSQFAEPDTLIPNPEHSDKENADCGSRCERGEHEPVRPMRRRSQSETGTQSLGHGCRIVIQNQRIAGNYNQEPCDCGPEQTRY